MLTKRGRRFKVLDIKNIDRKLNKIGLDIEYVTRKEDIILFLINYLGCATIEQLCVLFNNLETSTKTSIARILKIESDIIEIRRDEVNNLYYLPTRKALVELNKFCDVEKNRNYRNIKHLSKINDFYLILFKSNADTVTIEYEQYLENRVLEQPIVRADAIINVEKDENAYEFIVEQDNMTEKVTKLYNKIENYYNTILHGKFCPEKIKYFYFRFDILYNKNNLAKFENILNKSKRYKELLDEIDEIQKYYYDVKNNSPEGTSKFRADVYGVKYANRQDILLKNISDRKSELLKSLERFKRTVRIDLSCIRLKDRIKKVKTTMLKEFNVKSFDVDSIDTLYNYITYSKIFKVINSIMEAEDILLRTNILCGNIKTDYILKTMLFGTSDTGEHYLKSIIKHGFGSNVNPNTLKISQVFKSVGHKSLCFSNYCMVHLNRHNYDVECILLMPTISVSDHCKIEYLLNSRTQLLNESFGNSTYFFVITTDEQSKLLYDEKLNDAYLGKNIYFHVLHFDINRIDAELDEIRIEISEKQS